MSALTHNDLHAELEALRARIAELEAETAGRSFASGQPQAAHLLEFVARHAPLVVWAVDADGIFTMSKGHGLRLLGLKPGQVIGQSAFHFYGQSPEVLDVVRRGLAGEEFRATVSLGRVVFDTWCKPLRDEFGEVIGAMGISTVVPERTRAESAVRPYDELFSKVFHSSPVGILITDLDGGDFIDVNETFLRMTGYSRDELIGQSTLRISFWVDPAQRASLVLRLQQERSVRGIDFLFRGKRGELVSGRLAAELIEWNGRRCILSVCEDVTQRKLAEKAYRETQRRYRTLARVAPVGIVHADAAGTPLYVNEHWCSISGLTAEQTYTGGWRAAVHDDDRQRVATEWDTVIAESGPFRSEFRFVHPDDRTVWVLCLAEPEQGRLGTVTSYVMTVTDISAEKSALAELRAVNSGLECRVQQRTDELERANTVLQEQIQARKQALDKLKISEANWRSLVENAPDDIFHVSQDGTIQFINRASPLSAPGRAVGDSLIESLPPELHDHVAGLLRRTAETGGSAAYEYQAVQRDGRRHWYSSRVGPIRQGTDVTSLIVIATDITRQKEAEEIARRRQEELAHVARVNTMGEMISVIAHEMNNPLAAIANFAHGCVRRLQEKRVNKRELTEAMEDIAGQATRASDKIRELRGFLQKREVRQTAIDPNELVDSAISLIDVELRRHRILVEFDRGENLPDVLADTVQIEQVLINLLLNGVDATQALEPEQRILRVRTAHSESDRVTFSVQDTGPGLDAQNESQVFEPFYTTKAGGLGMGLSISRSIVEAHGGRLGISEDGTVGATFQFHLPVRSGAKP